MADESPQDDLPPLPKFAEFLQTLPPEALKKLVEGKMVVGEPDEGMKLMELASLGDDTHQPYTEAILRMETKDELHQTMAHLQAVLVNLHSMIGVVMARRLQLLLMEDDDLYREIMGDQEMPDWGQGA